MRRIRPTSLVTLAALVLAAGSVPAGAQTQEPVVRQDRLPSYPIEPAAIAFVARFDRTALLKDDVFVKALQDLGQGDLPPRAKADAFALMQARIGWMFVGASRLFPGAGYAQTMGMMLSTLVEYQQKMPPGIEVGPLLELARDGRAGHPLRASNALLLAVILNRQAATDAVRKAVDLKAIESAPVPAIDLHNTAVAAALTCDPRVVSLALGLLPRIESDESREDLLAVTSIYQDDEHRKRIEEFLRARFPASFDNSVKTALVVLAHAGPVDHFRAFYKSLGEGTKDKEAIDRLSKFWDSGFRDKLQSDDRPGPP